MPNPLATKDSQVGKLFLDAEEKIKSEPTYDLATLNACHQFWEFVALTDLEFDAWLHAHIKKAIQAQNASTGANVANPQPAP